MARKKKEEQKIISKEEASYVITCYGEHNKIIKREYSKDRYTAEKIRLDWIIESVEGGDIVTSHTNNIVLTKRYKFSIEKV